MTKVIERNTTIPARRTETFSTAEDNQTAVDVVVLQGERERAADNRVLGPVPAGEHPAGAARRAADRGDLRHRRQRHPERLGPGQGHRRRAADHHQRELEPGPGRGRADGRRRRAAPRRGPAAAAGGRRPQRARRGRLPGGTPPRRSSATRCPCTRRPAPRCWSPTPGRRSRRRRRSTGCASLTTELQQVYHGLGASASGPPGGPGRQDRRPRARSGLRAGRRRRHRRRVHDQ